MHFLWDIVSVSLVGFMMYPFVRFAESNDITWLWMGIGILSSDLATKIVKHYTKSLSGVFVRPLGAINCDILCSRGKAQGAAGFPSGHVTVTTFFFVYLWLKFKSTKLAILGIFVILLMAVSRVQKKCHNDVQVIAGAAFGAIMALLWFKLENKVNLLINIKKNE